MKGLLAFDSSTERLSIALAGPHGVSERESDGGAQASARIVDDIMALLAEAGLGLAQLDAIAFGRGPGAFTGLRTACAVAQGLALGAGKPVLAIDSLLAVAQDAAMVWQADGDFADGLSVWAVADARMGEVYAAHYRCTSANAGAAAWQTVVEPLLTTPQRLAERWQAEPPSAVAGPGLEVHAGLLSAGGALDCARQCPQARPRARALLPLACHGWTTGAAVDPALALPLYVRDKVAQTTAERAALKAAKEKAEASQ